MRMRQLLRIACAKTARITHQKQTAAAMQSWYWLSGYKLQIFVMFAPLALQQLQSMPSEANNAHDMLTHRRSSWQLCTPSRNS